jgi:hypothetical protein
MEASAQGYESGKAKNERNRLAGIMRYGDERFLNAMLHSMLVRFPSINLLRVFLELYI